MFRRLLLERKMEFPASRWFFCALVALFVFANAEIGQLVGNPAIIPPISVVWPATGFSLAALLLFGFKIWPGVFFGNFIYNFTQILPDGHMFSFAILAVVAISGGSLLQALVGAYIIRRLSSRDYFMTFKDVILFLIPGGVLACTIASTIGVATLYYFEHLGQQTVAETWLRFWLGDTMGVFIFTPFLTVWALHPIPARMKRYVWELFAMLTSLIVLCFLTFYWAFPLGLLFLPLVVWTTVRFQMHGATLSTVLIAISAIVPTFLGYGVLAEEALHDPLIRMVIFLNVVVGTSLILAALIKEREVAYQALKNHNINLEDQVSDHLEELENMHSEMSQKEKLAALGALSLGIARRVLRPLQNIEGFAETSKKSLTLLLASFKLQRDKLDPTLAQQCQTELNKLQDAMGNIVNLEHEASKYVRMAQEQMLLSAKDKVEIKSVNIHTLLDKTIQAVADDSVEKYTGFSFNVVKDYDRNVSMVPALPWELAYALMHLLDHAVASMKSKKDKEGQGYAPTLEIRTISHPKSVEIVISNNGLGASQEELESFFPSFIESNNLEKESSLIDPLIHDLIVYVHKGTIGVSSQEGQYLQINLALPKFS